VKIDMGICEALVNIYRALLWMPKCHENVNQRE